jgi:Holliday junction resolvase RusA-like endonuclease
MPELVIGADVSFFVPGLASPGGSKRAFLSKSGKIVVKDDAANNKPWRATVAAFALAAMAGRPPLEGPLELRVVFSMPRPKGHFHTGRKAGQVKPTAPHYHTSKPDATKLLRALEDALKLICWNDDSQVARQRVDKVYQGATAGAFVSIWRLAAREVA